MTENLNDPLTPVELFRRGIEISREIRGKIEETRAYYLGRSSHEPAQPLSEVFDPMRGPIIPYFVNVIRMLTLPQAYLTLRQSAAVEHEFFTKQLLMRESNEHKKILEAIEKVNRNQLLSHKLERQLLKTHDDHDDTANDSADDARHSTPVRAAMVQLTALKIYNSRASDANAIKYSFFKAFRSIPGAYDKYNSFSRAVDRMLRTYLS